MLKGAVRSKTGLTAYISCGVPGRPQMDERKTVVGTGTMVEV